MTGYFNAAAWRLEGRRFGRLDTQKRRWLALRSRDWIYSRRRGVCIWLCQLDYTCLYHQISVTSFTTEDWGLPSIKTSRHKVEVKSSS